MQADIVVSFVTFSSQELSLRLSQRWRFVAVERGQVHLFGEPIADIDKRGPTVRLRPHGPRELSRWVAWAIQTICPDSQATDDQADPPEIVDEPISEDELEKVARGIVGARRAAIAKEADPEGGAYEAVALVLYLVDQKLLEVGGSTALVARAVAPVLQDIDETVGAKLEDVLLEHDDVEELFAEAEELAAIVRENRHILAS